MSLEWSIRSWRLPDDGVVSNGATPREGQIPAYVTSVVAVRNLTVTRRKATAQRPIVLPIVGAKALRELRFAPVAALDVQKLKADRAALESRLKIHRAALDASALAAPKAAIGRAVARPAGAPVAAPAVATKPAVAIKPRAAILDSLAALHPAQRKGFIDAKYRGTTISSPRLAIPPRRLADTPRTDDLVTEPYELPGIAVLAFVCKRVPKAPDPDPRLSWAG